jgi:hypothetical protein
VRAEAIRRLEELNVLRLEPLGMDRRFNRYWLLCCPDFSITSAYTGSSDDFVSNSGAIPGGPRGEAAAVFACARVQPAGHAAVSSSQYLRRGCWHCTCMPNLQHLPSCFLDLHVHSNGSLL